MAHEPYHIRHFQYAALHQLKHCGQGIGQYGHSRCSRAASSLLLREQVRGVVSTYHVNVSVSEGQTQGIAVSGGLDGGVAFDAGALGAVISISKPQVCGACLCGELLALQRTVAEKLQFMCGGEMQYVQVHVCACRNIKSL